ncbi:MAG: D-tyrosyl-tRNA(Tyr) deacylase [Caldisericaceae bacterium]|nr:D-tyrosyl-tRNA(Tyr) deacylase [Caldisericaceae bacterium]
MRIVLQRVKRASVSIDGEIVSTIGNGLLILIGVEKRDTEREAKYLAKKVCGLRIFPDEHGKMNLSVRDINGEIMIISQFTLTSYIKKGNRPGFGNAAGENLAISLYKLFVEEIKKQVKTVKTGIFGAYMEVNLVNNGPVTFILKKLGGAEGI